MWELGVFVALLVVGYGVGSFNERRHYASIRRREEQLGELSEDYEELQEDCLDGDNDACREAVAMRAEMDEVRAGIPAEPQD